MIPGLYVTPDFITAEEEATLVAGADAFPFSPISAGRSQQKFFAVDFDKGPVVDGKVTRITRNALALAAWRHLPAGMPAFAAALIAKLAALNANAPFRLLVSSYADGAGMAPHIDESWLVPHEAFIVSTLSDETMTFTREGEDPVEVTLPRRSLLRLSGEALTLWKHQVAGPTGRRVSFHFVAKVNDEPGA